MILYKTGRDRSGFRSEKADLVNVLKKHYSFQVHYGHSKGNTPDGEKPGAVSVLEN